jgi:mRNA-degrading endonuclease toxin of MazEF toxin-antitoxin module
MDTSWWVGLVVVMVLALIATLVDGRGRSPRPPKRRRGPAGRAGSGPGRSGAGAGTRGGTESRPRPGEIWWANVPFEDGPGSKDRPCLVLSVRGRRARVAKITTKRHDGRAGVIALPADAVGDARGRPSFLETEELREVRVREFRRRVGAADAQVWSRVRHLGR